MTIATRLFPTLIIALATLSGCKFFDKSQVDPNPGQTVVAPSTGYPGVDYGAYDSGRSQSGTSDGPEYVGDPSAIGDQSPDLNGLTLRDDMNSVDGNRIEGLLDPVFFDYDSSAIRPDQRPKLQAAAEHLAANERDRLLIEGHADWRGTTEYNLALAGKRANSARDYMLDLGVAPARVRTVSKGDLEAVTEANEEQMARDRRAELIIER